MASSKEWTPARKHSFIVSILRSGSRRWPPRFETLNDAKTEKKINKKTGRLAQHFLCALCEEEVVATEVQVDHVAPVVEDIFVDWNTYIPRLFCDQENLQVLCKQCHLIKSKEERKSSSTKQKKEKDHTSKPNSSNRKRNS